VTQTEHKTDQLDEATAAVVAMLRAEIERSKALAARYERASTGHVLDCAICGTPHVGRCFLEEGSR
jgi:hypothetical protein